jgi:FtsH-binding integral membrane protein
MAAMINPSILPTAIGITGAIFSGASFMAYWMPKGKMLGYGRMFMGSLLGLIGLQLAGMGAMLVMGPNPFSLMLFRADTYLGILLFSGLIAYDTHVAIKSYEENNADHLGMSVDMLLNFWNILVRVIQILSARGSE